ncbi:MAG: glycosyltransferase family 1 protein [Planctomycetota bacterium]
MKPERTGVARYALNLVYALAEAAPDDEFVLCYRLSRFSRRKHRIPLPTAKFSQRWIQGGVRPRKVDVVHTTDARVHDWRGVPCISTVHDVFSLSSDEFASGKFRKRRADQYEAIAERATRIVAVSEYTRDEFWRHHPIDEDRFVVIPEGVEDRFRPEAAAGGQPVQREFGIHGAYVLFVGELSVRKNVLNLLDAWAGMPDESPTLVLAGRHRSDQLNVPEEVKMRGLAGRVVLTGYFPDRALPALYAGAECFVYPSLLEGFGLPVLEAMACGTPVVTTDRGALPEVSGGHRIAVDPEDPESIRGGILRVLTDPGLAESLRDRGLRWASLFRWPEVAKKTAAVYREVAG